MKLIALGDTHGRDTWKRVIDEEKTFDKVIFIGDYFDSFDITGLKQLENFLDICQFKKDNLEKVIMLTGNHDYHYWPGVTETYSGYQPVMRPSFEEKLRDNQHFLKMCYKDDNGVIYTHAGLTKTFLAKNNISLDDCEQQINELFKFQPWQFKFSEDDASGYGDHKSQSCIWVRPEALYSDKIDKIQVVGHTQVDLIARDKSERRGFYLIDAIGTRQYLVWNEDHFENKQLEKI